MAVHDAHRGRHRPVRPAPHGHQPRHRAGARHRVGARHLGARGGAQGQRRPVGGRRGRGACRRPSPSASCSASRRSWPACGSTWSVAASLVSLVVNLLFLFVEGLLAGRAVAGALNGARPAGAWRAGAIAAMVLWVLPILSLVTLLVSTFVLVERDAHGPVPGRRDVLRLAAVRRRVGAGDGPAAGAVAQRGRVGLPRPGRGPLHARRLTGRAEPSAPGRPAALPLRVRRPLDRVPVPVMRLGLGHVGHRRLRLGVGRVGDRRLGDGPGRRRRLGGRCLREVGRCLGGLRGLGGRLRGLQRLGSRNDGRIGRDSTAAGDGGGLLGRAPVGQRRRRRRRSLARRSSQSSLPAVVRATGPGAVRRRGYRTGRREPPAGQPRTPGGGGSRGSWRGDRGRPVTSVPGGWKRCHRRLARRLYGRLPMLRRGTGRTAA